MATPEKDPITGQYTTGHVWNGIKELRTPVPTWWLSGWLACIAFAVGYIYFYPSFPSTRTALQEQAGLLEQVKSTPLEAFRDKPELARFAFNGGRAAFAVNCIACHGAGAQGQVGQFPALIDDDWLWGGKLADIYTTIRHGIRNETDEARNSMMPAFAEILKPEEIKAVANYVLALDPKAPAHAGRAAMPGAATYETNCAGCHGAAGEGNRDAGAPRLNDAIWLYGSTPEQISAQIVKPRVGVMPAFGKRLSDEVVKMLTFYVHSLGGGETEAP
jgi:cytochrome c oxidase cbb3-type subunit 3